MTTIFAHAWKLGWDIANLPVVYVESISGEVAQVRFCEPGRKSRCHTWPVADLRYDVRAFDALTGAEG